MKLTKESHKLLSFFTEKNCLVPIKQTKKTDTIFKKLFNEISNGFHYIEEIKSKVGPSFYKLKIDRITIKFLNRQHFLQMHFHLK